MIINNPQEGEVPNINVVSIVPVSQKTVTSASNISTKEYQFKEVGIKLEIKPQISGENSIRLDISRIVVKARNNLKNISHGIWCVS